MKGGWDFIFASISVLTFGSTLLAAGGVREDGGVDDAEEREQQEQ
jgi:hypothetical protein